jgi:hypothetical protein
MKKHCLLACKTAFLGLLMFFGCGCSTECRSAEKTPVLHEETHIATEPITPIPEMLVDLENYRNIDVNDSTAFGVMLEFEIQHPHIVLAQMKIESGNYGSRIARNNNNYFGMRQPSSRLTVSLGSRNGYARYRSWVYSVLDYALWQRQYAWNLTEEQYLAKLGRTYAEDPNYVSKVKKLSKNLAEQNFCLIFVPSE